MNRRNLLTAAAAAGAVAVAGPLGVASAPASHLSIEGTPYDTLVDRLYDMTSDLVLDGKRSKVLVIDRSAFKFLRRHNMVDFDFSEDDKARTIPTFLGFKMSVPGSIYGATDGVMDDDELYVPVVPPGTQYTIEAEPYDTLTERLSDLTADWELSNEAHRIVISRDCWKYLVRSHLIDFVPNDDDGTGVEYVPLLFGYRVSVPGSVYA